MRVLRQKRFTVAYATVLVGVLLFGLVAWVNYQELGGWQYVLYLAAVLIWYGTIRGMAGWSEKPADDQAEMIAAREEMLEALSRQLDQREQALADRVVTYHEWMEFPQPVDLADPVATDDSLVQLVDQDRQTMELLETASQQIFDRILENRYSKDGQFQPTLLVQEAWQLAEQVARIYRPDSDHPLLETSTERVFYAISRACLQFLLVVEELPLNIKELNINSLYGYVRRAVQAYGVYKRARPFLQVASKGYYLGRYAMGANPVSMGAWWMLHSVGSRGAKALATRIVNQQALGLLNSVVRVIGFEVATLYGGDFRHRDPNWIYGVELVELMAMFPPNGEMLSHALTEVGAIQLRSEYDRVYLYRSLAAARSCDPDQYRAAVILSEAERIAILERLQRFRDRFLGSQKDRVVKKWSKQVENRLAVSFQSISVFDRGTPEQRSAVFQSLAGYAVSVKEREPSELPSLLQPLGFTETLLPEAVQQHWKDWQAEPPLNFEPPLLPAESPVIDEYLQALVQLAARLAPRLAADQAVMQSARYLGKDEVTTRSMLAGAYREQLLQAAVEDVLPARMPVTITCALLDWLEPGETVTGVFRGVSIYRQGKEELLPGSRKQCWLVATSERAVLLVDRDATRVAWQSTSDVQLEKQPGLVRSDSCLQGGDWLLDRDAAVSLVVTGDPLTGYDRYFASLVCLFG